MYPLFYLLEEPYHGLKPQPLPFPAMISLLVYFGKVPRYFSGPLLSRLRQKSHRQDLITGLVMSGNGIMAFSPVTGFIWLSDHHLITGHEKVRYSDVSGF